MPWKWGVKEDVHYSSATDSKVKKKKKQPYVAHSENIYNIHVVHMWY